MALFLEPVIKLIDQQMQFGEDHNHNNYYISRYYFLSHVSSVFNNNYELI